MCIDWRSVHKKSRNLTLNPGILYSYTLAQGRLQDFAKGVVKIVCFNLTNIAIKVMKHIFLSRYLSRQFLVNLFSLCLTNKLCRPFTHTHTHIQTAAQKMRLKHVFFADPILLLLLLLLNILLLLLLLIRRRNVNT